MDSLTITALNLRRTRSAIRNVKGTTSVALSQDDGAFTFEGQDKSGKATIAGTIDAAGLVTLTKKPAKSKAKAAPAEA